MTDLFPAVWSIMLSLLSTEVIIYPVIGASILCLIIVAGQMILGRG